MLLLSRKPSEKIMIGDNIQIEIVQMKNDEVIVGIRAPREVSIFRQELYDRMKLLYGQVKSHFQQK